ncbi:MAG: hypothetical protein J6I50_09740 [Clostridia bacterium]|nr:hypothetical protein [Clostridia bacterium]
MKSLFCFIIALFLLLCGCSREEQYPSNDDFFEKFLLTDLYVNGVSTPALFHPESGTTTPLCSDPLCDHTEKAGCPFAGYYPEREPYYYNGAIWFLSTENGNFSERDLICYDMDNRKVSRIISFSELREMIPDDRKELTRLSYGFGDSYFLYTVLEQDQTPVYQLGVNLNSRKVEVLDNDYRTPLARYGEKTLAYTQELRTTGVSWGIDILGKDGSVMETILPDKRISIAFTDLLPTDKLIYITAAKTENGKYDWGRMTVWLYDMKTREDRVIVNDFPSVYIVSNGNDLYYTRYVDDPPLLGFDQNENKEKYNRSGGILYRMDIRTGKETIAFEMPAYCLYGTQIYHVGQYIVVGYQNKNYDMYTEDITGNGIWYNYQKETGYLVYDTVSTQTATYRKESP